MTPTTIQEWYRGSEVCSGGGLHEVHVLYVDAIIDFDLRTAGKASKGGPKLQLRRLKTGYSSFVSKEGSNYEIQLGAIFRYERCPELRHPHATDLITRARLGASLRGLGTPMRRSVLIRQFTTKALRSRARTPFRWASARVDVRLLARGGVAGASAAAVSHRGRDRPHHAKGQDAPLYAEAQVLVPPSRCELHLVRSFFFLEKFDIGAAAISPPRSQRRCG